jgi:hypothetical protein
MILLAHLLLGAVIGEKIKYLVLAIILSFLSHYFLDLFPHIEYPIENIKNNQWQKSFQDFLKVAVDFCLGIFIIFLLSDNSIKVYICAFFAILPDGLTFLGYFLKNRLIKIHNDFHLKEIHFLKDKKISSYWRFLTQVIVIIISVILLKS